MFTPTTNEYVFKYLVTGISGLGMHHVYLPEQPPEEQILFKEEQKFVRPEMEDYLKKATRILYQKSNAAHPSYDQSFISPYAKQIQDWVDREWKRTEEGIWFWNNGTATYVTPFYYFYLCAWTPYFGKPDYRETDKEISYAIAYVENDPDSFGILFNSLRRYGKSAIMGAWIIYRTIRNKMHFSGMQGETDPKIGAFYDLHILKPFSKLEPYYQPDYNTNTLLTDGIKFTYSPKRGKKLNAIDIEDFDFLESELDYRPSGEGAYDQAVLHSYLMEEPGKTLVANVNERWKTVKPCLKRGRFIRGKAFLATTVEFMDTAKRGGKAYKKLFFESDFDKRNPDGRTKSGLYVIFLPADCGLEGFFDEWGHPVREKAREFIMNERSASEDDPKDYADIIRKYPLSISEIFYVNTVHCEFNAKILQDRKAEIDMSVEPMFSKFELKWENNVRFSKIVATHNPTTGWLKAAWLPTDPAKDCNLVDVQYAGGEKNYIPLNDLKIAIGMDPIDHGMVVEDGDSSDDEFVSVKRSRPVVTVKLKWDSSVDGAIDQDELIRRAKKGRMDGDTWVLDENGKKYQWKTNRYVCMMDVRPYDPNVLYERALMICWYFGASLHAESNKPGVIRYFNEHGCGAFILNKFIPLEKKRVNPYDEGTPASTLIISEYTGEISTYVEYFGHTIPFLEIVEDLLHFKPNKTREHDYTVSVGFTELACKMKPKNQPKTYIDISEIMPLFDGRGNVIN
jgi:hypothetical protein